MAIVEISGILVGICRETHGGTFRSISEGIVVEFWKKFLENTMEELLVFLKNPLKSWNVYKGIIEGILESNQPRIS